MKTKGALIYISLVTRPTTHNTETGDWRWEEREQMMCPQCEKEHDALWTIRRVPVEQWGHFMVFRINGDEWPLDASLPHKVEKIPRDAVKIEDAEKFAELWHANTGSHVFGF